MITKDSKTTRNHPNSLGNLLKNKSLIKNSLSFNELGEITFQSNSPIFIVILCDSGGIQYF